MLFKELEGDVAVLVSSGVYKQVPLYERNGYLFAKAFGGFVRLKADGYTSKAGVRLEHLEIEAPLYQDRLGRLGTEAIPEGKAITSDEFIMKLEG